MKYTTARLVSTPKSITAEVAIKTSVFKLNAAKVIPRIEPPVPMSSAINPENVPPSKEFKVVGLSDKFLISKNAKLITIKKIVSPISNFFYIEILTEISANHNKYQSRDPNF